MQVEGMATNLRCPSPILPHSSLLFALILLLTELNLVYAYSVPVYAPAYGYSIPAPAYPSTSTTQRPSSTHRQDIEIRKKALERNKTPVSTIDFVPLKTSDVIESQNITFNGSRALPGPLSSSSPSEVSRVEPTRGNTTPSPGVSHTSSTLLPTQQHTTSGLNVYTTPFSENLTPQRKRLQLGDVSRISSTANPPWHPPVHHRVHYHHGGTSRFGPYFEDGREGGNVTARLGSTVRLDCRIGMLQDKTVTWIHRKNDSIHLLTVGRQAYSSDSRFSLAYRYPNNWRLQILFVTRRDEGIYECQVATHPPRVRQLYLKVTAPVLKIVDENSHVVLERYYKAGSEVELTCVASQLEEDDGKVGLSEANEQRHPRKGMDNTNTIVATSSPSSSGILSDVAGSVLWRHGDSAITQNTSDRGIGVNVSADDSEVAITLTLKSVKKDDGGNYTCSVGVISSTTVFIHILNGELPAAVQYGKSTVPFKAVSVWLQISCLLLSCSALSQWHLNVGTRSISQTKVSGDDIQVIIEHVNELAVEP